MTLWTLSDYEKERKGIWWFVKTRGKVVIRRRIIVGQPANRRDSRNNRLTLSFRNVLWSVREARERGKMRESDNSDSMKSDREADHRGHKAPADNPIHSCTVKGSQGAGEVCQHRFHNAKTTIITANNNSICRVHPRPLLKSPRSTIC